MTKDKKHVIGYVLMWLFFVKEINMETDLSYAL